MAVKNVKIIFKGLPKEIAIASQVFEIRTGIIVIDKIELK